ncbi:MAG: TIGR02147 family protein [Fibrobacteres bacterium]|nr:TIGR02147 family protein [Fibrobacterota bacterium]
MTTVPPPKPEVKDGGETPSVFDYTDYRRFLKAYYEHQKRKNPAFSYRYFALKAKVNSSGHLKNVIDGKRGLGRGLIVRYAEAMKLKKKEAEYFEGLVDFNEARTVEEKRIFFERLLALRKPEAHQVQASQFEFYSKWYYTAVRELIGMTPFRGDCAALARALDPAIRPEQAEKAVRVLEEAQLIVKDAKGRYRQAQPLITTGPEVESVSVAQYQIACMDLAKEAIDRHEAGVRDISTLTLSLTSEGFSMLKEEIVSFRKKLLSLERNFLAPDRVYQLNLQFFPLSKLPAEEKP